MTKAKLSVTLSREVIDAVDREVARRPGATRSGVIESWLRLGARAREEQRLDLETVAYYQALGTQERREDEEWATFASDEFAVVADSEDVTYGDEHTADDEDGR